MNILRSFIKKGVLIIAGFSIAFGSAALFAAFEAKVVNVTAKIENALKFNINGTGDGAIDFGTVFPQEYFNADKVDIGFSNSFIEQNRVNKVKYKIEQKPKCVNIENPSLVHPVVVIGWVNNQPVLKCPEGYDPMPLLCPYISKSCDNPFTSEINECDDDTPVPSFHDVMVTPLDANDPLKGFTVTNQMLATGTMIKESDPLDTWWIDLAVPCFQGKCSEDWFSFVTSKNPNAIPGNFMLDPALESKRFGCDLWFEVTGITHQGT